MMNDDDWVKHALTDDSVVAELLSSLARPQPALPPPRLDWSVRQRRSRAPATRHHSQEGEAKRKEKKVKKKKAEPARASPTTPLSWSGGGGGATTTSASGGSEDSSKATNAAGGVRSKAIEKNEATTSKRPRKKKTLAELREDETILLKERKNLRGEIETIRLNVQTQRATNQSLKRLKLDLEARQKLETVVDSSVCEPCSILPATNSLNALQQHSCASSLARKLKEVENQEAGFSLPDLNLPADVDMDSSAAFYGIS